MKASLLLSCVLAMTSFSVMSSTALSAGNASRESINGITVTYLNHTNKTDANDRLFKLKTQIANQSKEAFYQYMPADSLEAFKKDLSSRAKNQRSILMYTSESYAEAVGNSGSSRSTVYLVMAVTEKSAMKRLTNKGNDIITGRTEDQGLLAPSEINEIYVLKVPANW